MEKYYFQEFNNGVNASKARIVEKNELHMIKQHMYLVGNTDDADKKYFLNAKHIAYFASHKSKLPWRFNGGKHF